MEKQKVLPRDIELKLPKGLLKFKDTQQIDPLDTIIGQQRAVEAIDFGLHMKGPEYNIFVTGLEGTGKTTLVTKLLTEHAADKATSPDFCLVNNFDDPYCPRTLEMPTGTAVYFSRSMARFIEVFRSGLPGFFKSDSFKQRQEILSREYSDRQKQILEAVEKYAQQRQLTIIQTEKGYRVLPVQDGQAMSQEAYNALDEDKRLAFDKAAEQVEAELNQALGQISRYSEQLNTEIKQLVAARTQGFIAEHIDPIRYYFRECTDVTAYLSNVRDDIIDHISVFLGGTGEPDARDKGVTDMADNLAKRYQVNVLVDRRNEKGAPVVYEPAPNFGNLFGRIEKKPQQGTFTTDFTQVKAGSILRANKGYLMIPIEPLLMYPAVWEALKRTLLDSSLRIEDAPEQSDYGLPSLKPAPVPLDVKVVLIGGYEPFRALQSIDYMFNKIFSVRADFDYEVMLNRETAMLYIRFITQLCGAEGLMPFSSKAVKAVIRFGARLADDREKLSLRFGRIKQLVKEAAFWSKRRGAECVEKKDVHRAEQQHRFRNNLYEEKVMEGFDDHSVLLSVEGSVVGQVNALAVYDMGEIAFGRPSRITAESYLGKPGIINVDHESDLSGQTHDKGVMIISGYLGSMFAQKHPLSVSISITFEQSYSGVDGDSASSTELYAVFSSLSGIPIRQDIAVTGSVNQKGEIQAIGGVNEKIEGFFDTCSRKGLTGTQGVMIPSANVRNLVLNEKVIGSLEKGEFHIWSVDTIKQGIEVLTGIPAGVPDDQGNYPAGTVYGAVQQKLGRFHELCRTVS